MARRPKAAPKSRTAKDRGPQDAGAKNPAPKNSGLKNQPARSPAGPVPGEYPIDTGTAALERDPYNPDGWILHVNGVPSSHVDMADPSRLDFEYMRWIAALLRERFPAQEAGRLRALHLGGGACSMARWVHAAYPEARQVVVELDGRLSELVREWFDLPRAPLLRLRVGEAREVLQSLTDATRDVVIRDVFAGDRTPAPLTTLEFTGHVRRVLDSGGLYVVNCGDTPSLAGARAEAATIAAVFRHVAIVADPPMLKGRRYGNVIIAGSDAEIPAGPGMLRELLGGAVPAQHWGDAQVRAFARDAEPVRDADPARDPRPATP